MLRNRKTPIVLLLCAAAVISCHGGGETAETELTPEQREELCALESPEDYNLGLAIGSVFILLGVSLLGCFIPILLSLHQSRWMIAVIRLGMAFGFGTILATAFIHMFTASLEQFSSPCLTGTWTEYGAWAQMFVVATIVFMQLIDYVIEVLTTRYKSRSQSSADGAAAQQSRKVAEVESAEEGIVDASQDAGAADAQSGQQFVRDIASKELELTGHHFYSEVDKADSSQQMGFVLVEAGIVLHSFLIGLTLGVADGSTFTTLLIALSFHQFFEGLAIGASAISTGLGIVKSSVLGVIYSLTTPAGIAVGIGIHETWNPNSQASLITQGVLDAVASGILIYVVLVELITPLLTKSSWMRRQHWLLQLGCIAAFWLGAAALAVIGKWA